MTSLFVNHFPATQRPTAHSAPSVAPVDVDARWKVCVACKWNVGDRCQNVGCKVCPGKQSVGLVKLVTMTSFHCPIGNF